MSTELTRDELFQIADDAVRAGFPDFAVKYLLKATEIDPILNEQQQDLLVATHRELAMRLRDGIERLSGLFEDWSVPEARSLAILKADLEGKLTTFCREFCEHVSTVLLPKVEGSEKAFYFLVIGDFSRFVAELGTSDSADATKVSFENYSLAKEAASSLPIEDPVHLTIILNMAKLLHDVMGRTEQAVELAHLTYNEAMPRVSSENETALEILQTLKENTIAWVTDGE